MRFAALTALALLGFVASWTVQSIEGRWCHLSSPSMYVTWWIHRPPRFCSILFPSTTPSNHWPSALHHTRSSVPIIGSVGAQILPRGVASTSRFLSARAADLARSKDARLRETPTPHESLHPSLAGACPADERRCAHPGIAAPTRGGATAMRSRARDHAMSSRCDH